MMMSQLTGDTSRLNPPLMEVGAASLHLRAAAMDGTANGKIANSKGNIVMKGSTDIAGNCRAQGHGQDDGPFGYALELWSWFRRLR
jgi:hypothetical protein